MPRSNQLYNWNGWFALSGGFMLTRDIHYNCSQSSMIQQIRNEATKRKMRVGISDDGDRIIVKFKPAKESIEEPASCPE